MSIEAIIRREQQRYVDFFVGAKAALLQENAQVQTEVLISQRDETISYPYRYMRVDARHMQSEGKWSFNMLHLGADPEVDSCRYDCGTFQLDIHPFAWSDMQIIFDKPPTDMGKIEKWITHWLDVEDTGAYAHSGVSGAIHNFFPVEQRDPLWILMGDMGTAPPEALLELLTELGRQGMSHMVIAGG